MMVSMVRSNDIDDGEDDENDGADICIVMKCAFVCVSQKMSTFPFMSWALEARSETPGLGRIWSCDDVDEEGDKEDDE